MSVRADIRLLVVDDEPDLRTLYELSLVREGYAVETASCVAAARELLAVQSFDAIITDMRLPDGTGLDLIRGLEATARREKAIVITAYGSAENAVEALKAGAYDYLTKPVDMRQFRAVVASAVGDHPTASLSVSAGGGRVASASDSLAGRRGPRGAGAVDPVSDIASRALARMAGASASMAEVRALIGKVARSMAPALVYGESGTGKELVARAIHEVSSRAQRPFVAVNCGAIPEQLLEAEFFGHRKGAFTGAAEDREGFFQAAAGGTLFLDEIGDLPLAMQSKLLRVIQERAVRAVGATQELPTDVRILSATHKDLGSEVQVGRFRQDLYYRLNVIQIRVPPLRQRREDLQTICDSLLQRIAADAGVDPLHLSADALARLASYSFPGNVRELENLLHRAVAMANGPEIGADDLGLPVEACSELGVSTGGGSLSSPPLWAVAEVRQGLPLPVSSVQDTDAALPSDLAAHLDGVERELLARALREHRNNRTAAGAALGLSLRQMRYRMARLGIQINEPDPLDGGDGVKD